ncbi:MAG: TolC family protein [Desulfobacterales bacterium]|nr:TolC family protein [Desulfobacterales bacterium]
MKKVLSSFLFFSALLNVASWTLPQPGAEPLDQLIFEALHQNSSLNMFSREIAAAQEQSRFDASLPTPRVGLGLANLPLTGLSLNQEPMTQKQLSVTQRLPWPGKRHLASQISLNQSFELKAQKGLRSLELAHAVRQGYYDIWYLSEKLHLNQVFSRLVEDARDSAVSRYESGRETQQAVLMGELELTRLTEESIALKGELALRQQQMNALLERKAFKPIEVTDEVSLPEARGNSWWLERALRAPERARLRWRHEKKMAALGLAEKNPMPDVDVKLSYGQREADSSGRSRDDFISVSLSFPVPLWKASREDRLTASRRQQARAAHQGLQGYDLAIPHRISALVTQMETAAARHQHYLKSWIPRARQLADALVSRYEVGEGSYETMIRGLMDAMQAEVMGKEYLRQALVAESELMRLAGVLPESGGE